MNATESRNWIDAHAHLTDPRITNALPEMIDECARAGITRFILGGISPDEWERQKQIVSRWPGRIFSSFGLHPWWVAANAKDAPGIESAIMQLREELAHPAESACVAIGETGLDFHPRFEADTHAVQERVFREQIRLALSLGMPVVLHIVRAHDEALRVLREEMRSASVLQASGIVHSFADEPGIARAYLDLGLYPSISAAVITRGRGAAFEKLKQTMVTLMAKEFVLETDAPDQPPYPREEGDVLNPPVNLLRVAEAIARIRGESATEILDHSRDRVRSIFGLPT